MRMEISELTQAMHQFVRSRGWYEQESPRPQTLRNLAISLNLEAAEVLEHFQWRDEPQDPAALADELADVALYLLQIASIAGVDLERAILNKLEQNYQRHWDQDKDSLK
jgi:NTP pyrophosphatase (non-canonical NTP hydrolase)